MELSRASRSPHLRRDGRARLDLRDGARAADRPSEKRARGLRPRAPQRVRDPHDIRPDAFTYRYRFTSDRADTVIHLDATVEVPRLAAVLGPLAAGAVRRGVNANLAALKRTLEAGGAGA